jgi:hypothetical protein
MHEDELSYQFFCRFQLDVTAFKALAESPSYFQFKKLCQWYHLLNCLTEAERKKLPPGPPGMLKPRYFSGQCYDFKYFSQILLNTILR